MGLPAAPPRIEITRIIQGLESPAHPGGWPESETDHGRLAQQAQQDAVGRGGDQEADDWAHTVLRY